MKVFWLKKYSEEAEHSMYRSFRPPRNISVVKIKDNLPFNYLTITNPESSMCIYTLHDLQVMSNENNIIKLLCSDDLNNPTKAIETDKLKISHQVNMKSDYIELSSSKNKDSLFKNNYAIILPGGSLIITSEKNTSEVDLNISWSVDNL